MTVKEVIDQIDYTQSIIDRMDKMIDPNNMKSGPTATLNQATRLLHNYQSFLKGISIEKGVIRDY